MTPSSEAEAYALLEQLRWGGAAQTCPHCSVTGHCYYLRPADGVSRRTRTGARSERRIWKCGACRRQFSVLTGTLFEGTRVSLRTWVAVVEEWARAREPLAVAEVASRYGLTGEAARQVLRRVATALEAHPVRRSAPDDDGRALLTALLHITAEDAASIRARTPARRRPRRQVGPSADYGGADPPGFVMP